MYKLYGGAVSWRGQNQLGFNVTGIYKQGNHGERKSIQLMRSSDKNNKNADGQASVHGKGGEDVGTVRNESWSISEAAAVKNDPLCTGSSPKMLKRGP